MKNKRKLNEIDKAYELIKTLKTPNFKGGYFLITVPTEEQKEETKNLIEDLFQRKITQEGVKDLENE